MHESRLVSVSGTLHLITSCLRRSCFISITEVTAGDLLGNFSTYEFFKIIDLSQIFFAQKTDSLKND